MKVINFIGNVDKRILVLPLARSLTFLGETLLITDDTAYKRMINADNIISGIKVLITEEFSQNMIEEYDDGVTYSNIIFDTTSFIYEKADKKVICRHKDRRLVPGSILEELDKVDIEGEPEVESEEIVLTAQIPKKKFGKAKAKSITYLDRYEESKKKAKLCALKPSHYYWLCLCEEAQDLSVIQDKDLLDFIVKEFIDVFGMSLKDFTGLLAREK